MKSPDNDSHLSDEQKAANEALETRMRRGPYQTPVQHDPDVPSVKLFVGGLLVFAGLVVGDRLLPPDQPIEGARVKTKQRTASVLAPSKQSTIELVAEEDEDATSVGQEIISE